MRSHAVLVLVLLLGACSACAGPRLVGSASTARLPAPAVRRVELPAMRTEGTAWPLGPAVGAPCET